jgi:putative transposase
MLQVSRAGFYAWQRPGDRADSSSNDSSKPLSNRRSARRPAWVRVALVRAIREAFTQSRRIYGSRRVAAELRARNLPVCRNTVAKLMRAESLVSIARRKRRFVPRTTDSGHTLPIAPNVLNRDFAASAPNRKWAADITYVPTAEGFLYLSVIMDLHSRRIIGWNMDDSLKADLVREALRMALLSRRSMMKKTTLMKTTTKKMTRDLMSEGLIHHSDRGSQYASAAHRAMLQQHDITPSMSRAGDCYDNAMIEAFFSSYKSECVTQTTYPTRVAARSAAFDYIEIFYNRQRRHSALNYLSPEAFEKHHEEQTKIQPIPQNQCAH